MLKDKKSSVTLAGLTALVTAGAVAVPLIAYAASTREDRSAEVAAAIDGGTAKNVILLIGDGMGDSEITIARNYAVGAAGRLSLDTLPLTGAYTTYSVQQGTNNPDYVPDSASTGTAWATGNKTYDGGVAVDTNGVSVPNLAEIAKAAGYKTGNVSTAAIQDATPAVQESHVTSRSCFGPERTSTTCPTNATENGGAGSISEQIANGTLDVVLGGGASSFQEVIKAGPYVGMTVEQSAKAQGFSVAKTQAEALAIPQGRNTRVLGLFAEGNLDLEFAPLPAVVGGTGPAQRCVTNPDRPSTQPKLDLLTSEAIKGLDKKAKASRNGKGFFLQIEGASIDKQDHAANLCGQIGENLAFDRSVKAALDFQKKNPDTLVIVTADHAHTSQIANPNSGPGAQATVLTADDQPMTVNYGTAPVGSSQQHTGAQVRVAAGGPQAANVVGVTDQTDLFFTMRRALGLG